jgi:hypothetical protein
MIFREDFFICTFYWRNSKRNIIIQHWKKCRWVNCQTIMLHVCYHFFLLNVWSQLKLFFYWSLLNFVINLKEAEQRDNSHRGFACKFFRCQPFFMVFWVFFLIVCIASSSYFWIQCLFVNHDQFISTLTAYVLRRFSVLNLYGYI